MYTLIQIVRPFLASALLLTIVYQQLVGRVYVQGVYSVEIETRMNETERQIATILKEKLGLDTRVKLHDASDPGDLQSMGYGAPVLISETVDGQTYVFTTVDDPVKLVQFKLVAKFPHQPVQIPETSSKLAKIFPSFYLRNPDLLNGFLLLPYRAAVFPAPGTTPSFDLSVPVPPPRRA